MYERIPTRPRPNALGVVGTKYEPVQNKASGALLDALVDEGGANYETVVAGKLRAKLGGVRVGEATPARIDAALRSMRNTHGPVMAQQAKTILSGGLQLAVMANVLSTNPVRDVQQIKSKRPPKGAPALTVEGLRALLVQVGGVRILPRA